MIKRVLSFIEKYEFILVLLCLVALLRLPGLFEPNRYADEDIYLTIGQGLRKGLVLYRDIYDNKTPLIYVVAALAGGVMWFRFILMIWNLVNVVLFWGLAKKLLAKKVGAAVATVLFAVFTTLPLLEGEIANGEIFMILPVTAAVFLVLSKTGHLVEKRSIYFWSGVLWSVAFLFKTPPAVELFGLVFFMLAMRKIRDGRPLLLGLGFLIPVSISIVYFFFKGVGITYLQSALLQNISYLSSWGGGVTSGGGSLLSGGLTMRVLLLFGVLALFWRFRRRLDARFGLIVVWAVTAMFGAFLSGRPYPHYLIEVVGPMALLAGFLLTQATILTVGLGFLVGLLLAGGIIRYKFWYYKSLPYYQNFMSYVFGKKSREKFYNFWGDNVTRDYEAAAFIGQVTRADERIFVWGTEPALYVMSKRIPAVKYTVAYHILDFSAQEEVGQSLIRERPKVIAVLKNERGKFSELLGIINADYAPAGTFGDIVVYLRLK